MENEEQSGEYQANDAGALVGALFSGGITVVEAIERLRTRLLDLSARNSLLNYRHPKARSLQIADDPNINLVFERLYADAKAVPFKYVPEPPLNIFEGKRPEARLYAARLGMSISLESHPDTSATNGRRLTGVQTLLYPADLERQLRKISSEAKTAIEETGSNMLFLVFGFLEFYDSDDSERAMLAPLLSLPVNLVRGEIDSESRTYRYTVQHNGEDLAENQTLREKLRRDFMLSMPEFEEEDDPETYFGRIDHAVKNKRRWKVRRQITLGMLSFGKLAMWADLDTKRNPGLTDHDLIRCIFSGGSSGGAGELHAEDYRIDVHPQASQPLIYDADSSQHSAIIDVLAGKNLVVNGPPGTGKSQTITNIIAAAMSEGKKVLFVSEKLAALEVVRHRLNRAGLGHFCLELHSHKTQKKRFLEDIDARMSGRFPAPAQFQAKLLTLKRQKTDLARYAELMGSRIGNALDLTVHEVFWAAARRKQDLGDLSSDIRMIRFPDAPKWTHSDIESRMSRLSELAKMYDTVGRYDTEHTWWGFSPDMLAPPDNEDIDKLIRKALAHAVSADASAAEAIEFFELTAEPDAVSALKVSSDLELVPPLPEEVDTALLARLFDAKSDPRGLRSSRLLSDVASGVTKARQLLESASRVFANTGRPSVDDIEARDLAEKHILSTELLIADIGGALESVAIFEKSLETFGTAARIASAPYGPAGKVARDAFLTNLAKVPASGLGSFTIRAITSRASAVLEAVRSLSEALSKVGAIAARRGLPFDTTPESVARIADPDGLPGLSKEMPVDASSVAEARRLSVFPLADKPTEQILKLHAALQAEVAAYSDALARCRSAVEQLGISFDSTERGVEVATALASVAAVAPCDLLEYRLPTFAHARTAELIESIRRAISADRSAKAALEHTFFLDDLPSVVDIKLAITALRRKDGLFACFDRDWRNARKLHSGLCKDKGRGSGRQRAENLAKLVSWMEANSVFASETEFAESFGKLFRGLDTDHDRIARLHDWYVFAHAKLVECPGLVDKFNLTTIPADRLAELAAKAECVTIDSQKLSDSDSALRDLLSIELPGFREAKARGWAAGIESLGEAVENLGVVAGFFVSRADADLSPRDATRLMEARSELDEVAPELQLLMHGAKVLREAGCDELELLAPRDDDRWSETLAALAAQASLAAETAAQGLAFASEDSPLSAAHEFAMAKSEFESSWTRVASLPVWNMVDSWSAIATMARESASAARRVLELISPYVRNRVSANEFFTASCEEAEARTILERFDASDDVRRMLGEVFSGADTDLNRLSTTHGWGDAVCALGLPTAVRDRILSLDASEAIAAAQRIYREIAEGSRDAREAVDSLYSYGSFSWDEWQRQARTGSGRDLPSEIRARLEAVIRSSDSVLVWSKYLSLRQQTEHEGMNDFLSALESGRIPSKSLAAVFEHSAFQSIGRAIYQAFPELMRFNGDAHEKTRTDFRNLDAEIVGLTGKEFAYQIDSRKSVPQGQRGTTVGEYTELHLLKREINKQRKHIPIRQLLKRAGRALQELKPCFMMGPLSVAQYLEQGSLKFDLVVMDEASQLRPEEAMGAVARGAQLVVVGDPKQLPPTSFFDRMIESGDNEDEDEAPAAITGMESILDICQQLFTPVRSLRWHYRSHHESLIAFSNHHFYKNLIVFPSPYAKNPGLGVKYRYVKGGSYKDRQNVPEAQRLVDAVLDHMIKHPEESLGVVTLNQTQRELIEDLLDKKLKTFEEGADFIGRWEAEGWPFFVKNLENVQGDERDVIFISTTFGKVPGTDKVRQNFGPISRPDGWRRLNVLFTRSKRRIELFTSMSPDDIIVDDRTPAGTKALRDYLEFAKRGVLVTTDEGERQPDSDFEVSVANVVTALGYEVKPQLGVAGFFIDMAVRNPDRPGEFLAAIECDGATYHSGFSVRDRDRIRQEILESLGWRGRIYRIWSTDWFYNPRSETERLQCFLEERRRNSGATDPAGWEEEDLEQIFEDDVEEQLAESLVEDLAVASDGFNDLFVEVGDRVTYCEVDEPGERYNVLIVDGESNPNMDLVNERTPLAQTLIGLHPGDVGILAVPGQEARRLRIIRIERLDELSV